MDWAINLYAKAQGLTGWLMDVLPLLGAAGGILGVASSVLIRAGAAHDPAGLLHAIHPTPEEAGAFALSWGVLRAHFKHNENAQAIAAATAVPLPNGK